MLACRRKLGLHFALLYLILSKKSETHSELEPLIKPLIMLTNVLFSNIFGIYVKELWKISRSEVKENLIFHINNLENSDVIVIDYKIINHFLRIMLSFIELANNHKEIELILLNMIITFYPLEMIDKLEKELKQRKKNHAKRKSD